MSPTSCTEKHEDRVQRLLAHIGTKMNVAPPTYGGATTAPANYDCWTNQVFVGEVFAKSLNDDDLAMMLAHEVGHSTRRRALVQARLAIFVPLGLIIAMSTRWLDLGLQVNRMVLLAGFVWFLAQALRGPRQEEFIADDFAVAFKGPVTPYRRLLERLLHDSQTKPDRRTRARLRRLLSR